MFQKQFKLDVELAGIESMAALRVRKGYDFKLRISMRGVSLGENTFPF